VGRSRGVGQLSPGDVAGLRGSGQQVCQSPDAYALGWSYKQQQGVRVRQCHGAYQPAIRRFYNFLTVAVQRHEVTVKPVNQPWRIFDPQTYTSRLTTARRRRRNLAGTACFYQELLTWTAASDNTGVAAYYVYRTAPTWPPAPAFPSASYKHNTTDKTAVSGTATPIMVRAGPRRECHEAIVQRQLRNQPTLGPRPPPG